MKTPNQPGPSQEIDIHGGRYTVQALDKAVREAAFVGSLAGQLLNKYLEENGGVLPDDPEAEAAIFTKLIDQAERWRLRLKVVEKEKLERYDREYRESMPKGHNGQRIIIPDADMMRTHLPPGSIPHVGG